MAEQTKPELDVPVSHRLPESLVASVDQWAQRTWRDRAKILSAICCRVLEMVRQEGGFQQDLSDVLRRLRLDSA
ncbi:MAG: hypothetical protein ABSA41_01840 [Terriglobia bacterium]|jgi:hypothetical protein